MRDYAELCKRLRSIARLDRYYNASGEVFDAAADAIEELLAKDTNVPNKWISVEERLPDNTRQQIVRHRGGVYFAYYNGSTWYSSIGKSHPLRTVTHWMPLPEPPKGVE